MNRLTRRGRSILAVLVALTIGGAATLAAGPATAATTSCNTKNAKLYLPSASYPYYRLQTSYRGCYLDAEKLGWRLYSMHHWRCGDFNCHSFWVKHPK